MKKALLIMAFLVVCSPAFAQSKCESTIGACYEVVDIYYETDRKNIRVMTDY